MSSRPTPRDRHVVSDSERQIEVRPLIAGAERHRADDRTGDDASIPGRQLENVVTGAVARLDAEQLSHRGRIPRRRRLWSRSSQGVAGAGRSLRGRGCVPVRGELPLLGLPATTGSAFKAFAGIEREKLEITQGPETTSSSSARKTERHALPACAARSSSRSCATAPSCTSRWGRWSTRRDPPDRAHLRRLEGGVVRDHRRPAAVRRARDLAGSSCTDSGRLRARLDHLRNDPAVLADLTVADESELLVRRESAVEEKARGNRAGVLRISLHRPAAETAMRSSAPASAAVATPWRRCPLPTKLHAIRQSGDP